MSRREESTASLLRLRKSRLGPADLLRESWRSVTRDLGRSIVAALGALLGCAAFVATLGITGTAGHQISASFDIRRATEVTVTADAKDPVSAETDLTESWFTSAAAEKARTISGVITAGRVTTVKALDLRRLYLTNDNGVPVDAYAVDTGSLSAIAPEVTAGRTFDEGHQSRADAVVMLSKPVAAKLGITQPGAAVFIGDLGLTVIGIYEDVARVSGAVGGILLPISVQESTDIATGQIPSKKILLETEPGAAVQVGRQAALAVSPAQPDLVDVIAPPDPKTLRQEVESSTTQLSLIVSLVILAVGAVSIGNTTAIQVILRTPEIGLRRALGARRSDIFLQLLGETTTLGFLGGTLGAGLGVIVTVTVSVANSWVPVLDPVILILAIAAGTAAGVGAGVYPAFRATKITPAHALTR